MFDAGDDRVRRRVVFGEIHPGLQADIDPPRDDPEGDVRALHPPVREGNGARSNRLEHPFAGRRIARLAAPAGEVRVALPARIAPAGIDPVGVGLPDFHHRVTQRRPRAVVDNAGDGDALTFGGVRHHCLAKVCVIEAVDPGDVGKAADMNVGPRRLAGAFLQIVQRLSHHAPSIRFSNIVWRRPRSTMSNLYARASIGTVRFLSSAAVSWSIPSSFGMPSTMGH